MFLSCIRPAKNNVFRPECFRKFNFTLAWRGTYYFFFSSEINESRAIRAPVARVHVLYKSSQTSLLGAVVKLSDLRLIGSEIEFRSRHGIFNLNIGSIPD